MWFVSSNNRLSLIASRKFKFYLKHFYTSQSCWLKHSFVYYSCMQQVCFPKRCLAACDLSRSLHHTFKGWKVVVNPKLADAEEFKKSLACEEGSDAVLHSNLLADLNSCDTVGDQIRMVSTTLGLSAEDDAKRQALCDSLYEICKPYFPSLKIIKFGSSANTLGFKGSDIDVCIYTDLHSAENTPNFVQLREVPTPDDVLSGRVDKVQVANLFPKLLLRFIRRLLRKHGTNIREPIFLIRARLPILRFYDEKLDLYCDFSCENRKALQNTKLIRFISHLDERFGLIARALRYWGKNGRFVGDVDMFNSYSFSLLVVYFLQNVNPPVLPPLNYLISNSEYLDYGNVDDDELLFHSLKNIPKSENTQTPEELFREFFFFYTFYDFKRVMLPLTTYSVPLQEFRSDEDPPTDVFERGTVSLQDPFRHSFNATSGLAYNCGKKFLLSLIEACRVYQDGNVLKTSSSVNWGISPIFESAIQFSGNDSVMQPPSQSETIKIAMPPGLAEKLCDNSVLNVEQEFLIRASSVLRQVLEQALLFQVVVTRRDAENMPILRFQCEALCNTWVGRNRIIKECSPVDSDSVDLLEAERQISLALVKGLENRQPIFRLGFECIPTTDANYPGMEVKVSFVSGRFSPAVSVFLKGYLPKMLRTLL